MRQGRHQVPKFRGFEVFYTLCVILYMSHPMKCEIDSILHMLLDITSVNNTMIPRDS